MEDRFLDTSESVKRLVQNYKDHENLIVAFDFDNTVYDYAGVGDAYPKIEALLWRLKKLNISLILFTCNEGEKLLEVLDYCKRRGYEPDFVNVSPLLSTKKPYYNILLDDRAGLGEAYQTLTLTLNTLGL